MKKAKAGTVLILVLAAALAWGCTTAGEEKSAEGTSGASVAGSGMAAITESISKPEAAGKTLVVYYSQGNATRSVAGDLALLYGADVEEVLETKTRKTHFFAFMYTGFQSTFKLSTPIQTPVLDPSAYDRVFVLTPVWSWSLSPPMRSWLRLMKGKLPAAAFVTVSGDTKPDKIVAMMIKESGTTPKTFAGFGDKDFLTENRETYVGKLTGLIEGMR